MYVQCRLNLNLFIIGFYIPLSCANTSERSAGSPVWCLGLFLSFYLRLRSSVCYRTPGLQPKYQTTGVNCTAAYTTTVCCNRTALNPHCLPINVEARELNLKYARATGELNPGPFAPAAECITDRPTIQGF